MTDHLDTTTFAELGLGIMLNWTHASTQGWEQSWQMTGGVRGQYPPREPVPCDQYFANSATFDPHNFDADRWARDVANAGASYAVFSAKHHDGFALWDTRESDYSIVKASPYGRDVVAELVPALRSRGLRIGLYFSIVDWYSELYPRFTDDAIAKPYEIGHYPRSPETWDAYRGYLLAQLTELLTAFGPIDIIWLDGEFEHTLEEWNFAEIREHIRALQPWCLVNDRCVGFGDFRTPEQQVPEEPPSGAWEQCMTMNNSWGYVAEDDAWKSPAELIEAVVETRIRGGNLLLSVGPTGDGSFPDAAAERLAALGAWTSANRPALHGLSPGLRPWQHRLPSARQVHESGERIYLYLTMTPGERIKVRDLPVRRITGVQLLSAGAALAYDTQANITEIQKQTPDPLGDLIVTIGDVRDVLVPVIAIDIEGI